MVFTRPVLLTFLALLPLLAYLGWPAGRYGRGRAWTALVLRCLIGLLIVLSLAGIQSVHGGDELAVVFLLDVSDSVSEGERERAEAFVEESLAAMGADDRAAVVLFGTDALVERPMMAGGEMGEVTSIPRTQQTDLEGAIRLGVALFPSGAARRLILISDGRPTLGEAEQAVRAARAQGIQVDVLPLLHPLSGEGRDGGEAWLSELEMPNRVHQDEEFTLSITARATVDMAAVLTVLAGERVVAREEVHLNPGDNRFAIPLVASQPGFRPFRVYLAPASDVYPQNNGLSTFTLVEGPPRILVVGAQEEDEGTAYILAALEASGLAVAERTPGAMVSDPAGLAEYGAVVLVDTPAQAFSPRALTALQSYVRDLGGGLVTVGGTHAYGVGGWYNTPLEETLPVEMTIHDPERFPPMSIVVVIDKSGSMGVEEGGVEKIRLAGEAAARVAELITVLDEITVIAFDDRPVDVIGPLPGSQRDEVIEQVIRLQAGGGGIYVRESLREALGYLSDSDRTVRHIILLADGSDSEHQQGVPEMVEEEIAAQNITLSTVAIGAGQDLRFLEQIAVLGNGRYHFTNRAASLPVIFAEETQLAMRSYIVEEPFYPQQTALSPILTGIEAVPQLAGYVATTPKPTGRVILATHQNDPLLAVWQYGLGRAAAWTSDGTARWAQRWVSWDGFPRFWAQTVRWTIVEQVDTPVEVTVALEGEEAHIGVDVADESGGFVNGLEARVSLVGPDGEVVQVNLAQTAPGRYEGEFVPEAEGAYVMRLTAVGQSDLSPPQPPPEGREDRGRLSPEGGEEGGVPEGGEEEEVALTTGWVMGYSPEYAALEGDPSYLARLAELGGGEVLEEPAAAVAHTLRGEGVTQDLWPYLLASALLLLPVDIGVRRLVLSRRDLMRVRDWVAERLPRRRQRPAVEALSPVARLFQAKSRAEGQRAGAGVTAPELAAPPPTEGTGPPVPPSRPEIPLPAAGPLAPQRGSEGGAAAEGDTLAGRLLKKKQEREEG